MIENWLPCPGYEDTHMVSSAGNVLSKERFVRSCYGSVALRKSRVLKNDYSSGYARVHLGTGHQKLLVHRLVATAFIGQPPSETSQVNHIDGIKTNNEVSNLEWTTCSENLRHSFRKGLSVNKKGDDNPMSKPIYVYKNGVLQMSFRSTRAASEHLGTSVRSIDNHIRYHGGRWKGFVLSRSEQLKPLP